MQIASSTYVGRSRLIFSVYQQLQQKNSFKLSFEDFVAKVANNVPKNLAIKAQSFLENILTNVTKIEDDQTPDELAQKLLFAGLNVVFFEMDCKLSVWKFKNGVSSKKISNESGQNDVNIIYWQPFGNYQYDSLIPKVQ